MEEGLKNLHIFLRGSKDRILLFILSVPVSLFNTIYNIIGT